MRRTSADNVKQSWHSAVYDLYASIQITAVKLTIRNKVTLPRAYHSHATMSIYSSIYTAGIHNGPHPHKVNRLVRLFVVRAKLLCIRDWTRICTIIAHTANVEVTVIDTHVPNRKIGSLCSLLLPSPPSSLWELNIRAFYYRRRYTRRLLLFHSFRSFVSPTADCMCSPFSSGVAQERSRAGD